MENVEPKIEAEIPKVNVIDPDTQEIGSIPKTQLREALSMGYSTVGDDQVKDYLDQQKYSTPGQAAIGVAEQVGRGALGPLPTIAEKALGVKSEDIEGREKQLSGPAKFAAQTAGLVGSALSGVGLAPVLERAGVAGVTALGLNAATGIPGKIGSAAIKTAIEGAAYQGSEEINKQILNPNLSKEGVETAITDMGMAALLGGGFGAGFGSVSPLWNATVGPKVGQLLKGIADKMGGIDGSIPDAVNEALSSTGMQVAPEVRAGLSQDPYVKQMFQTLQESSTGKGVEAQQALKKFKADIGDYVVQTLGKSPQEIGALSDLSEYEVGKKLQQTMAQDIKSALDPLSERFDQIRKRFNKAEIDSTVAAEMADKVATLGFEKGYNITSLGGENSVINQVIKEIPNIKNLDDLAKYQSALNRSAMGKPELYGVVKDVRNILRESESALIENKLAQDSPELLDTFKKARGAYQENMQYLDNLNDRLHVGKYFGPGGFIKNLEEMKPEDLLRRMEGKKDVGLQNMMLPHWEEQVRDFHLSRILKGAMEKAGPDEAINAKALFKNLEKMSPELRGFVLPEGAAEKLGHLEALSDAIPAKMNTSGTAKTLDALLGNIPGAAAGLATLVASHNPAVALLVGGLTKYIGRDIPDAARLSLLKFLGSNQPVESGAFKSMVDFVQHTVRGENLVSKASKNVFKAGMDVLPSSQIPNEKSREKLEKHLTELQKDSSPLFNIGGKTAHYMPEHGTAMGEMAAKSVNYLQQSKPGTSQMSPLDRKIEPPKAAVAAYERKLDIAEQPLMVLKHIKEGTLQPEDVVAMKTMYPALYQKLNQKLTAQLVEMESRSESIPYSMRMSLSLFMGQPLDSTLTPMGIQLSQPTPPEQGPMPQKSMSGMAKLSQSYQTAGQASEAKRAR